MPRTLPALSIVLLAALATVHPATAQDVAYEKYKLPNGLTVILHEDHSVPSVVIDTWYRVGSKDEADRRSGFAHLFEHLMFMGTERVPDGDFDTIMETGGGFNNASTSEDRTNYFSVGPSELLPTLLWLDADRLQGLGNAMTQEKLDKQRAVVRNERRQSYENRPYGRADLVISDVMFPAGHPYHHPVIGSHEDLEAATVEDVKGFFDKYYVPSNASLVVAGDFDPEAVKPLIAGWFGTLPRGSDVVHRKAGPVSLGGVVRLTLTDKVQFARTEFVYNSPKYYAPGDAEMDLVAGILTDGISSRLYRRLVTEEKLALDVTAFQESMLLGSLFHVRATARQGVDLDDLERAMDEEIADLLEEGPSADELEKLQAQLEFTSVSRLQSVLGKADRLNQYEFYFGEPNSFKRDMDRYRDATTTSVRQWAGKVMTADARLVLRVIPEIEAVEPSPLDRRPAIAEGADFAPPMPESFRLANGLTVHHWERHELPMVAMTLLLPVGTATDPPEQAGLTWLAVDMVDEGAGDLGAEEFSDALDLLGASLDAVAGREAVFVNLSVLTRNFDPALDLFADALRRPRFDEDAWERVHTLHVQELKRAEDEPGTVASNVAMRAYFGDGHPYGRPSGGTPETAMTVGREAARRRYERLFRPDGAVILAAGDLATEDLRRKLEKALGGWRAVRGADPLSAPSYPQPATKGFRVVLVDRPDAVQTVVRFVMPGPVYGDPRRLQYELLGTILGGSFTSRLNQNLREEHGYTYGAGCAYSMDPSVGYFTAASRVRADVTGASVGEFMKEFEGIRRGNVTGDEARKARKEGRMEMIQSFEGLQGILAAATRLVLNGRPFSDLGTELAELSKIGAKDLNAIARQAVPLDTGVLVLVGDERELTGQLAGLGLPPPVELTVEGNPVGSGAGAGAGSRAR